MNHNKKLKQPAAWIGMDWADQVHAVALTTEGGKVETLELKQTPEAIDEWAQKLRQRFDGQPIAVCLEQSKGALIYALMKYDFFILYPINPKQLARFREAVSSSGAKDDLRDARLLLELLRKHGDQLHAWQPDDAMTRLISQLNEDRRTLIGHRTRLTNALKSRLKQYFPLALEVLGQLHCELACRFLLRWPTLEALQQAKPQDVRDFYQLMQCRHPKLIEARLQQVAQAMPLVTDSAVLTSGEMMVRSLVQQLLALIEPLKQYDAQLASLMEQHPDRDLFASFPGAGDVMTARLVGAFGSDRDRLESSEQLQSLSGIAPVTVRSGKSHHVHRRWACTQFLRQTFHEYALHSLSKSTWAKAYYDLLRSRGKAHHASVRALAFKWIRILFRCWKTRTLYNETHYLCQLHHRHSPLIPFLPTSTP